jgi:hypothetical protein
VTNEEIGLLRTICREDLKTYLPASAQLDALQAFDALVASLQKMRRAGWIELEVQKSGKLIRSYLRRYKAAAARCTRHGREALSPLGES